MGGTYVATAFAIGAVHALALVLVADDFLELEIDASIPTRVDFKHGIDRLLGRPAHAHTHQLRLTAGKNEFHGTMTTRTEPADHIAHDPCRLSNPRGPS